MSKRKPPSSPKRQPHKAVRRPRQGANPSPMDNTSFDAAFRNGTELLHAGESAAAVPFLERALALDPDHVNAALNLSGAYILTGQFKQAVAILEPLSERAPTLAPVWTNLGAAYLGNPILAHDEEQLRAIAAFERALEINPVAPSVAYNIGLIYRDRQETELAAEWFHKAIQHNPNDQDARRILARLAEDAGAGMNAEIAEETQRDAEKRGEEIEN